MDEYIKREEAKRTIVEAVDNGLATTSADLAEILDELPAADVAPVRHGRWDGEGDGYAETEDGEMALVYDVWNCSECGYTIDEGIDAPGLLPNYCPNCGAKMDGGAP